ncbi:hypothetical protein [Coleofasciculus sp. FACHB-1120]|nr:hypothetical protein [Coleofasciculus sp. FACHB-1120]
MNSNLFSSDQETYFTWLRRQMGQRSQFCPLEQSRIEQSRAPTE